MQAFPGWCPPQIPAVVPSLGRGWGGGRAWASLSAPGEGPQVPRGSRRRTSPCRLAGRGGGGMLLHGPHPRPCTLCPPRSGARDCTCTPTRQTRTLNSLKLLPMKIRFINSHSLAGAEDAEGAQRDGEWQGESGRGAVFSLEIYKQESLSSSFYKMCKIQASFAHRHSLHLVVTLAKRSRFTLHTHAHMHSYTGSHN